MTTTETTTTINKIIRIGTIDGHNIFCKIQYDGKKLSISGVEGPMSNGNAKGSAGQILMRYKEYDRSGHNIVTDIAPAPSWNIVTIKRFFDVWNHWHLNDMRSGCEHQRAEGWGKKEIEVITYTLTHDAMREQRQIKDASHTQLLKGETVQLPPHERDLLSLEYETHHAPDADSVRSGRYEVKKRETKLSTWVYPKEHPDGVLTKPCPTCGHKFGSAWLFEEVPQDVLDFLQSLPDTDKQPAWV